MSRLPQDPRLSIHYARANDLVDLLDLYGPMTLDEVCTELGTSVGQYKDMRYSHGGRLALEDRGVTIPRPVADEGWTLKLASAWDTGSSTDDARPNSAVTVADLATKLATIYVGVETLIPKLPPRSANRRVLHKLLKAMDASLDRVDDAAKIAGSNLSPWVTHVLERISPP